MPNLMVKLHLQKAYRIFKVGKGPLHITQNKRATINIDHLFEDMKYHQKMDTQG